MTKKRIYIFISLMFITTALTLWAVKHGQEGLSRGTEKKPTVRADVKPQVSPQQGERELPPKNTDAQVSGELPATIRAAEEKSNNNPLAQDLTLAEMEAEIKNIEFLIQSNNYIERLSAPGGIRAEERKKVEALFERHNELSMTSAKIKRDRIAEKVSLLESVHSERLEKVRTILAKIKKDLR